MLKPAILKDEHTRLEVLAEYNLRGAAPEPGVEMLVRLAARAFGVPTCVVNLVDETDVFFQASVGADHIDSSLAGRDISFCAHAVADDETLIVPDATRDLRFHDNPLVTGPTHFRFYAGVPLHGPGGHRIGSFCIIDTEARSDFSSTDRVQLEDMARLVLDKLELRRLNLVSQTNEVRFKSIADTSPDSIICADGRGSITFWNTAAERMFGYAREEAIGRRLDFILPMHLRHEIIADVQRVVAGGPPRLTGRTTEMTGLRRGGNIFPGEISASMWRENGEVKFAAIVRDITDRKRNEDRLERLAHHDHVTGLPNRSAVAQAAAAYAEADRPMALVVVEAGGFKDVIATLGHAVGDALLCEMAARLQGCVETEEMVARLEGEEFALLLTSPGDLLRAAALADEAIAAIMRPFDLDGHQIHVTAHAGIAAWPSHGDAIDDLLGNADLALGQARIDGRGRRALFTPPMRSAAVARRTFDTEIRRAIDKGEFELFYQPQVRLSDGALTGAEALIRWRHPERGLVSPGAFLPVLEGGVLAATVGDWVLETASAQAAAFIASGAKDFRMGVNLFAAQFRAGDLVQRVRMALQRTALPPSALELEITENIVLDQDDAVLGPLHELRDMGVGIAFDDYGTGYASLSLLKRYPITRLKIDQTFVRGMCESDADAAIIRAVLYLGQSFGLEVIAEGIETEDQRARLIARGCHAGQGYLFGRPVPAAEFSRMFISPARAAAG